MNQKPLPKRLSKCTLLGHLVTSQVLYMLIVAKIETLTSQLLGKVFYMALVYHLILMGLVLLIHFTIFTAALKLKSHILTSFTKVT